MKPLTSAKRRENALKLSVIAMLAIMFLHLSYLQATLHHLQMMRNIFYGSTDSLRVDSVTVASTACKDSLNSFVETAETSCATDEIVAESIDKILGNITFFETVTYFLIATCAIIFVYCIVSSFRDLVIKRRKSSFADLPPERAKILNEYLLDPVGLCKVIDQRILQVKNKSNKSDLLALDYLYLSRTGIIKPRTKSAYQKAFLESFISNSQFSDKVNEIEMILDNERLPDALDYRGKFSDLKGVFNRFDIIRKNPSTTSIGNSSEDDRKSE